MTTNQDQSLRGLTEPRIHTPLHTGKSRMQEVADLADSIEMPLLPYQRWVLDDFLAIDNDGKFKRKIGGLMIARQNGKTHLARMLILWKLLQGEKVLAMSSNRNMALDTFQKVAGLFEEFPFLKQQVKAIRYANGTEKILLNNGGLYEVAAATRDGARGKTVDFLYIDELREINEEAWTAARPTTRARPNSQTFTTTNAGDAFSTVLLNMRERAFDYPPPEFAWYEYSAPQFARIDDKQAWAQANPALGYLFDEAAIAESVATNSVESTRTETLCQFVDSLASPFPNGSWEAIGEKDLVIREGAYTVFAFDKSPSGRSASLVGGWIMDDGRIGVSIVQSWESSVQVDDLKIAADIKGWCDKFKPRLVCYDKYATQTIADRLGRSGLPMEDVSGAQFYQACGDLLDSIVNKRMAHPMQPELDKQMNNVAAKTNDSSWRIVKRKSAGDVTAPISLAMVVHQLLKPIAKPAIYSLD
nr:MAG: terminase large subunit [Caudoviricetes sp.]